ncbi:hypothetical protein [Coralloluteibacterium thermophilus]|uniref:Class I SAM-dependent methyltransferase n=1 Tax=Coralloluteibacterium thermophilum TaxID=2707049 RepID=A0ABV9NHT0_9GAMM
MIKSLYIHSMRGAKRIAGRLGILQALERSDSRGARWTRSLFSIYDSRDLALLDLPWWTFDAIREVEQLLASFDNQARVFEYGAGASTLWLSKRCAEVISVEHDIGFADSMAPLFSSCPNVNVLTVPDVPATGATTEARSRRRGYEDRAFDAYVDAISSQEGMFDLIVIDGRARTACLARAAQRLSPRGLILFDNSERKEYRAAIDSSPFVERRLRGLAPALPLPSQTSLLEQRS